MADESIIADLKSQGFDKLIQDLSLSAKGFTELDKSMAEAQKKLDTLDKSSQEFKDLTKEINAAAIASKAYAESNDTLKKELRDTTNEIGNLERSIKALEKAGQTNTQTYKDLTSQQDTLRKKAGELKDTIGDLNAEIKNSGSDTRNLDKAVRAISTVASGYQVAQGALALYGGENKKFEQTLLKLNAVMAITQGLQQIQEELSKRDSVFTQAAAKAKLLYAAAIGTSTGAMKAFKVALLSTGIGVLIVGVTTLIANFDDLTKSGGFLSKALNGIGDVVSKSIQAYKDLSDAIGLTNFAAKKAAEDEKIRQDEALDDLLRAQKVKIAILKIQGKETAEFELQLLKDEKVRNRQKLLEYDGLTDDERKKVLERQKVLSDEIEIQEAVIKQISIDASKKAFEELKKLQQQQAKERIKDLKIIAANLKEKLTETFEEDVDLFPKSTVFRSKKYFSDIISSLERVVNNVEIGSDRWIYLNSQIEKTKKLMDELSLSEEQVAVATKKTTNDFIDAELKKQDTKNKAYFEGVMIRKKEIEDEELTSQEKIQIAAVTGTEIFNLTRSLFTYEQALLDNKLKTGLISQKEYDKELKELKRKEAIANKAQAAFNISISIAEAIVKALTAGPIIGQILAGITAAFGFAQLAVVLATPLPQFRDGGQVSKKLGLIKGARHERGGVPIEVEGEEYVMPVEQTKENLPALEAMRKGKFNELFIPKQNVMQPDVFANIPNPSNIALPIVNENSDYSSINKRLDKLASEMWWLGQYTKEGNKDRKVGTQMLSSKFNFRKSNPNL
jgi:hypothetical protein